MKIKEKQLSQINENSLLHFARIDSLKDIEEYGIKRDFTNNAIEQATTYKATFSKGPIGLLKMTDMWISNLIYSVGLDRYFSSLVSFTAAEYSEIKDNYKKLYKEGKTQTSKVIESAFEYLEKFLNSDVILEIEDTKENIIKGMLDNYELDKTYNFDREVISEKLQYIDAGVVTTNEVNMITNGDNVNAKDIIKQLYEEYKGLSFEYLDDFINYINNKELNPELRRTNKWN